MSGSIPLKGKRCRIGISGLAKEAFREGLAPFVGQQTAFFEAEVVDWNDSIIWITEIGTKKALGKAVLALPWSSVAFVAESERGFVRPRL